MHKRGDTARPIADDITLKNGDVVYFAIHKARQEEALTWLHTRGWQTA